MKNTSPTVKITTMDGQVFNISVNKAEMTVGRGEENDITIPDDKVSRIHAKLIQEGEGFVLIDHGSRNGIFVNKERVPRVVLEEGIEVNLGNSNLTLLNANNIAEIPISVPPEEPVLEEIGVPEEWTQKTIKIDPEESLKLDTKSLLSTPKMGLKGKTLGLTGHLKKENHQEISETEFSSLERMNKVLFVLFEISRHLNSIRDFNELLKKIMDLILEVIDADYGALILSSDIAKDNYSPVVVEYKNSSFEQKGGIIASKTIVNKVIKDKVALLTSNAMVDSRFAATASLINQRIKSVMCVPLWEKEEIIGVIQLGTTRRSTIFTEDELELLKAIGCQMAMILEQASLNEKIRTEEQMRRKLERFHSPQVVDVILKSDQEKKGNMLEAKELICTILFTDIVGFTPLSEKYKPIEINALLNQHFSMMTDIIFECDGTLDKYIGDALMAIFGAPISKKDDAERAIRSAINIRQELEKMGDDKGKKLNIRIGINTGPVIAGSIGSPKRMDYTVIGDAVNVASRLESEAGINQILIGEETYKQIKGKFNIKEVGARKLKGREKEITVYEVLD